MVYKMTDSPRTRQQTFLMRDNHPQRPLGTAERGDADRTMVCGDARRGGGMRGTSNAQFGAAPLPPRARPHISCLTANLLLYEVSTQRMTHSPSSLKGAA